MKLAFYGDDFTGSTDVMEALALSGHRVALFLEPPSPADLRGRFENLDAVGVAGTSRAMTPAQMDAALPAIFEKIKALGAPMVHYKVCSTFDSSPRTGSIGRAIEIGRRIFDAPWVPLVVGAPPLRRYCVFGNLFATADGATHRIDRHPTMRCHPVTPMDEGDLRVHLSRQTALPVSLMDVLALSGTPAEIDRRLDAMASGIVLFDVLDDAHLAQIGRLLSERRPPFVAGSSGVEYALRAHERTTGSRSWKAGVAPQVLVVSGSCSPVTRGQIGWALERGFAGIRVAPGTDVSDAALDVLGSGRNLVLYTALGPDDPSIAKGSQGDVGTHLGRLAGDVVRRSGIRRVVVAGGDTSGYVARQLGIRALEMAVPIAPGSPLCRAWSPDPAVDGLEIAMKGGQVGKVDYFESVLNGAA